MSMQQSVAPAGEAVPARSLCVVRDDGRIYRFRHEPREEILGVAAFDAAAGSTVRYLAGDDAISEALLYDFIDRN